MSLVAKMAMLLLTFTKMVRFIHQWLSEFVTQYWFSIYYSSRYIKTLTAVLLF